MLRPAGDHKKAATTAATTITARMMIVLRDMVHSLLTDDGIEIVIPKSALTHDKASSMVRLECSRR